MNPERELYVVSEDVSGLMNRWSRESGYQLPDQDFFKGMVKDLHGELSTCYPGNIEILESDEIKKGLESLAGKSSFPVISLDRAYVDKTTPNIFGFIDSTRVVNERFEDIGLLQRPGALSVEDQVKGISRKVNGPITLLEDVIFSGEGILHIAGLFSKEGSSVAQVVTGIGIGQGIRKIQEYGIRVDCIKTYDWVIDEICQRDFVACVPMSGRTVMDTNGQLWSAPYFLPFGNAQKWASIPDTRVVDFSEFCLDQSITLWKAVERESQAAVPMAAVPRKLKGVKESDSIVRTLSDYKAGR